MKGKLYGIGVGPGDPELLTLKALRLIRENEVIAVPGNETTKSVAYQIVKGAYDDCSGVGVGDFRCGGNSFGFLGGFPQGFL